MDDPESIDPRYVDLKARPLQDARSDFAPFYRLASFSDAQEMNALIVAHYVVEFGLNTPRTLMCQDATAHFDALELKNQLIYTALRERIEVSTTFASPRLSTKGESENHCL